LCLQLKDSGGVELEPSLRGLEARNAAVAKVMADLRAKGVVSGWRDELFPVIQSFSDEPLLLVERAAATQLGIKAYGVHINGYVRRADGSKELWVGRRSKSKQTWPGMLDHIVAGECHYCRRIVTVIRSFKMGSLVASGAVWTQHACVPAAAQVHPHMHLIKRQVA
jgi:hypothetical protein